MECYRLNCKEQCNKYKMATCIFKLTKEQHNLIADIKKYSKCNRCGSRTVKANYKGIQIQLCTECGVRNRKEVDIIG